MTKRITLLSMVLMLAGILATAQNNTAWQPDTVYIFQPYPESVVVRHIYQYNQQGLLITETGQFQQNDTWKTSGQCTYTYDANNNLKTKLHENWGSLPDETYSKYTYTYDSRNNLLTELVEDWRGNNTWNNRQDIMTYDENNNLLTQLRQYWNQNNNTWSNSILNTYTYDSNNNLLKRFIQIPYNNAWSNVTQSIYTYDLNNNRLTYLDQAWANDDSGWIDIFLYTYTYYSNNNRLTELYECYTDGNKEESTYIYDADNNLINQLTKIWQSGNWVNKRQINYTYDSKKNMKAYLREEWANSTWVNDLQQLWTYDENDNCTLVENFSFANSNWYPINIPMYLYYNNMQNSFYYNAYKVTAKYIKVVKPTAIEDFVLSTISIYPNPTSGQIKITNDDQNIQMISIYNLSGFELFKTQDTTFDISHLTAGIYFVQIMTTKGIITKKIVKM